MRPPQKIDLSKATKLSELEVWWNRSEVKWITSTLKSARHKPPHKLTIRLNPDFVAYVPTEEWTQLDAMLVKLRSKLVLLSLLCSPRLFERVPSLLPRLTEAGFTGTSETKAHPAASNRDIFDLESSLNGY